MAPMPIVCSYCPVGLHFTCLTFNQADECCCPQTQTIESSGERQGRLKDAAHMRDPLSTGRKRAAQLFPLPGKDDPEEECEWAFLKYAGGGVKPIIGCGGNPMVARHHGPDKDIINNAVGNVHRICVHCHNRWHTLNDPFYGTRPQPGTPFVPLEGEVLAHDLDTLATDDERLANELYWHQNPAKRAEKE